MRRLRLHRRAIGTAGTALAVVLAAGVLSVCDASPYAATVNGSTISQAALNTELRWAAAAPDYTSTVVAYYEQATNAQLVVQGDSSNTYSSAWTAYTLSQMIQGRVVRQVLQAQGRAPTSDLYAAALGGIEIENEGYTGNNSIGSIAQMNPAYLVDVTQRLADHADLETPMAMADIEPTYTKFEANFYSQVCVTQASVSVANTSGGVDFAASQTQAAAVAQKLEQAGANSGSVGGASTCYTHEQLDAQPPSFIDTVVSLAPGHATTQKTNYGYQVVSVSSRQTLPLAGPVAQVITTLDYDLLEPSQDSTLQHLASQAKVRVDPGYGSWTPGSSATLAGVVAPSPSPSAPVGSSVSGSLAGAVGSS